MLRGVPNTVCVARARSMTIGSVPEATSASGTATHTSTHATAVLHHAALTGDAVRTAVDIGRVPANPWRLESLTDAATNPAMNAGVASMASTVSSTSVGVSRNVNSSTASNG